MSRRPFLWRILALLLLLFAAAPSFAAERILLFHSNVDVETNGDLVVTETIRVNAEDRNIRHGIYRDFPILFRDKNGRIAKNSFELISATRDGRREQARVQRGSNMVRIYLGRSDQILGPGVYTYQLKYRTDRQIRFFADHDEIDWNATGTEWIFPIQKAIATIHLPPGAEALDRTAYTGAYGSRSQNARSSVSQGGSVVTFETTAPLGPHEGLTVVVSFPKGHITPPTEGQRLAWYMRDNSGTIISLGGLAFVSLFYFLGWLRVGRDPPEGVVVPRWDLPDGVSPALTHYIWNHGLKRQGFPALSAAAINLAVHGYLELDDIGDTITLRRTEKATGGVRFPVGEAALLRNLELNGGTLEVSKSNGSKVSSLGSSFRDAMEKEHRSVFYRHNYGWIVAGVVLSVVTLGATLFFGNLSNGMLQVLIPALIVGFVLTIFAVNLAKSAQSGLAGKIRFAFAGFVLVIFLVNSGIFAVHGLITALDQPLLAGALATLVLVNLLFFFLMGAPTKLGRKRTDEIEGLKRYLSVAEKDRMNMAGAPEMSPQHYETLLPYAVALNVEKPWSRAFDAWLASAVAAGVVAAGYYAPTWYRSDRLDSSAIGEQIGGLAGSMSDSFTASLPAPSSSSSGFSSGGGFSGGGGGGGGGGGW